MEDLFSLLKKIGVDVSHIHIHKVRALQCDAIRSEQFANGHFHKPTTYEQHVTRSSEQMITFARQEYGRVGVL